MLANKGNAWHITGTSWSQYCYNTHGDQSVCVAAFQLHTLCIHYKWIIYPNKWRYVMFLLRSDCWLTAPSTYFLISSHISSRWPRQPNDCISLGVPAQLLLLWQWECMVSPGSQQLPAGPWRLRGGRSLPALPGLPVSPEAPQPHLSGEPDLSQPRTTGHTNVPHHIPWKQPINDASSTPGNILCWQIYKLVQEHVRAQNTGHRADRWCVGCYQTDQQAGELAGRRVLGEHNKNHAREGKPGGSKITTVSVLSFAWSTSEHPSVEYWTRSQCVTREPGEGKLQGLEMWKS